MRASTSIAAPRLNAGGERWKALCNRATSEAARSLCPNLSKSPIAAYILTYPLGSERLNTRRHQGLCTPS
jgi:hypothetical protein